MIQDEKWYTVSELALLAKDGFVPFQSPHTWYTIINSGGIKHIVKGRKEKGPKTFLVQGRDLKEYLNSLKKSNAG